MPSSHLILYWPLLLPPSIFPSIRVFSNESVLSIRWPKYWNFSFSISPSNEYSGLISFRMNWLDLLVGIRIILISEILKHERNVHFTTETIEQIVLWLKRVLLCKKFRKWSNFHHYLTLESFSHWALRIHFLVSILGNAAAAAAAKSLQSCPTLCDPIDGSPPGSPVPGILHARTLEWFAISFSNAWKWKVKVKSLSRVRPLAWTAAYQAPLCMGFSRQEY